MRLDIHQFGVFEGDVSSMPIMGGITPGLQAGSHKYGSLTASPANYLRWVHQELHNPQAGRVPPPLKEWMGADYKLIFG